MQKNNRLAAPVDFIMNNSLISGNGRHAFSSGGMCELLAILHLFKNAVEQFEEHRFNLFTILRNAGQ